MPAAAGALLPRHIVAFTFTEKAAAELKHRIVTRCSQVLGELPGLAEMYVGTIHAFCLEMLKGEVPKYLKFEVLNEVQQGLFVDRLSKQSGLTTSTDLNGHPSSFPPHLRPLVKGGECAMGLPRPGYLLIPGRIFCGEPVCCCLSCLPSIASPIPLRSVQNVPSPE